MQKNIFFISIFDFLIDIPYRISIVSRYGSSNFIYIEIVYSNGPIENHENSFLETEEEGAEILLENQISRVLYSRGIKTCRGPKLEQIHKRSVSFSHFFPKRYCKIEIRRAVLLEVFERVGYVDPFLPFFPIEY